jgi:hypothetical protein
VKQRQLYIVTAILSVVAVGSFAYKSLALKFPLTPYARSDVWNVEARVTFEGQDKPVKVSLLIPHSTRRYTLLDENFISHGYGLSTTRSEDDNREAVWSVRAVSGRQTLYYRAKLTRVGTKEPVPISMEPKKIEAKTPDFRGPHMTAARALLTDIRQHSADTDTMVAELMKRLHDPQPDQNIALLLGKQPTKLAKMELAVDILALAGLPARVTHGIRLEDQRRNAPIIHWLQVFNGQIWRSYYPATVEPASPGDYFPWWRGTEPVVKIQGGERAHLKLSVIHSQESGVTTATVRGKEISPKLIAFSLVSLPLDTQAVYRVLLMVPLGALVLVLLRNIVGLKTFGTFMPVLIALAFRETQLIWGIVLFSLVVALGLAVRFYLDRLKLLLVPRLAAVLIVVVLVMALLSVLSHALGIERGLSVALFPMVIMTMTIERMSIVWDERGANEALLQGLGSLVAASIAYLMMFIPLLEHLIFIFPELLLLLLAATLLLGRYSGYRLSELMRFKVLAKEER